jgi:hypothetical protein
MQLPPLTLSGISLLLAIDTIILLFTAEMLSQHYGQTNLTLNKKKLKNVALIAGMIFLVTVTAEILVTIAGA